MNNPKSVENHLIDELHNLCSAFKNEAELRSALRTLFSKVAGIERATITHGTQELGKDLVFYTKDYLGQSELHACVWRARSFVPLDELV